MKLFTAATTMCCLALIGAVLAPTARADALNKKTVVTFSGPVEIPGVHLSGFGVLPAGTYVFKIVDSQSDRHIVQIFSEDEKTTYATVLAIPNYRLKVTDKTVMTFTERPAGEPEALRAWFYPGRNSGEEFVYPKARAMELAKAGNMPVLYTSAELPSETVGAITADQSTVGDLKRATVMAVNPSGQEVQLAEVVEAPPAEVDAPVAVAAAEPATPSASVATPEPATAQAAPASVATTADTLPATASSLPIFALWGLLAIGGAAALWAAERHLC